ncbi:16S rRNA (guanine527-N7)-methyltransferase [Bifidobacterium commune]|uniref:Ribosomal RNA small subunit methyltransferase G n=2 Tax=Bifidobacterium commune TaxID=1505727 RepID=A0A1C4H6K9_9BIFI|nr:16S rRNA (guanine(527)-N(7))-methyltransferase RsmG [Bifidobacterium commune]MBB2955864.1 16S rRNA (guanine527-N7)-methyltransferase [Bifidobacterium commune]SCC80373.1 16S rRNA (guanine527-N7)-methyltransferase [Bifidobacterium commune]
MEFQMHTDDELEHSSLLEDLFGETLLQLRVFQKKLATEGEQRGLIGPRDVDIIWERHILNSAAVVPFIEASVDENERFKTVADVGSGGGFPGIVVAACLPNFKITLIEPMERRVEWLNECVSELGLDNVTVLRERAENCVSDIKHKKGLHPFSVVTCRAVAPLTKLSGWTLPLLKHGGQLIALKGRSAPEELRKAGKEILKYGGCNPEVFDAPIAEGFEPTHVAIINKK